MRIDKNSRDGWAVLIRLICLTILSLWASQSLAVAPSTAVSPGAADNQALVENSGNAVVANAVSAPEPKPAALISTPSVRDDGRTKEDEEIDRKNRSSALLGLGIALALFLAGAGWLATRLTDRVSALDGEQKEKNPLLSMPLGMPEGSIRALLSIFVIVFGFAIVVLQNTLGLESAEAITGFIGAVIAFYFSSRTEQAVRETTEKAAQAQAQADVAVTRANDIRDQLTKAQIDLDEKVKTAITAAASGGTAAVTPEAAGARQQIEEVQGKLTQLHGALTVIAGIKGGPELFDDAADLLGKVKQGLDTIAPVLSGNTDAATLSKTAADMSAFAKDVLPREPVVSTILDVLSQVTAAAGAVSSGNSGGIVSALSNIAPLVGLAGGPVTVVGGIVASGIGLVADAIRFDRMKAALTERPFDLILMQVDRLDGNAALQVLDFAPLISRTITSDDNQRDQLAATELYRTLSVNQGEAMETATALAAAWRQAAPAGLEAVVAGFDNDAALISAIEEYRTAIITLNAIRGLPPQTASINPGGEDRQIPTSDLIKAVQAVRQIPGAADAVDRIVSVVEALGGLAEGDRATLLRERFATALGLLPGEAQAIVAANQADADEARQVEGQLVEEPVG